MIPTVGRIVHYELTEADAVAVNRCRADALTSQAGAQGTGYVVHHGNVALPGQVFPLLITRVWGTGDGGPVNGQVFLDGNDTLWVTSRAEATDDVTAGRWSVPPVVTR